MNAIRVRVYRRDNAYWLMPVSADESRATLERINARYGTNLVESD
jgi:hypothetical protein